MPRLLIALASAWLTLMTIGAAAQGVDFESRGFRGQIYVGKTYPPRYSSERSYNEERSSPRRVTRSHEARRSKSDDTETAQKSKPAPAKEAKEDSKFENSSIAGVASTPPPDDKADRKSGPDAENSTIATTTDEHKSSDEKKVVTTDAGAKVEAKVVPAAASSPTCSRYFPTVGKTLEVPCE